MLLLLLGRKEMRVGREMLPLAAALAMPLVAADAPKPPQLLASQHVGCILWFLWKASAQGGPLCW